MWPLERYHNATACGIFGPEDKLELLSGKLVKKISINPPHAANVSRLIKYFTRLYLDVYELRPENPVTFVDASEPEPDFAICDLDDNEYEDRHPASSEIHLTIEVAENSLYRDRTHKAKIYASAAIAEYWIINLKQFQVEVHLDPDTESGAYGKVVRYKRGAIFTSPFVGKVAVDDLLPKT